MRRLALALAIAPLLLSAAEPALPPGQESEHVVKPGETLGGVAQRAEVPRVLIIEANRLTPPYALRAGQKLTIPRTRHHTIGRGDTRFTISYLYGVPWADIAVANNLAANAELQSGQKLLIPSVIAAPVAPSGPAGPVATPSPSATTARFTWPLAGAVQRGFIPRTRSTDYHEGIDIRTPVGTAVRASSAGKVLFAGDEPRQFGKLVVVEHEGGWQSAYAFLSRITVKEGDSVGQGERVGLSGQTGRARGPELHYEMRRNNRPVNPVDHLPRRN